MEDFVKDEIVPSVNVKETKLINRATGLNKFVEEYRLNISGYKKSGNGEEYIYCKNPLAGAEVIEKSVGLMSSFCSEANLMSSKEKHEFARQKFEILETDLRFLLRSMAGRAYHNTEIYKMMKMSLIDIGSIISDGKAREFLANSVLSKVPEAGEADYT